MSASRSVRHLAAEPLTHGHRRRVQVGGGEPPAKRPRTRAAGEHEVADGGGRVEVAARLGGVGVSDGFGRHVERRSPSADHAASARRRRPGAPRSSPGEVEHLDEVVRGRVPDDHDVGRLDVPVHEPPSSALRPATRTPARAETPRVPAATAPHARSAARCRGRPDTHRVVEGPIRRPSVVRRWPPYSGCRSRPSPPPRARSGGW